MDKVSQSYWDHSYSAYKYGIANDAVTKWLEKHLTEQKGTAFEPGCYPGRYLSFLGKLGWIVNGMDLTPRIEEDFKEWLTKNEIRFNKIEKGDVLAYMNTSGDQYDLVCSFGFIEHFENFLEIIAFHDKIVRPGGQLVITTPNFRGSIQKFLHRWLDTENLKRHYVPAMNPSLWNKKLKSIGYTVNWYGYFGHFDFWADQQKRNLFNKISLEVMNRLTPLFKWLPDSHLYSPYCGIVATRSN